MDTGSYNCYLFHVAVPEKWRKRWITLGDMKLLHDGRVMIGGDFYFGEVDTIQKKKILQLMGFAVVGDTAYLDVRGTDGKTEERV